MSIGQRVKEIREKKKLSRKDIVVELQKEQAEGRFDVERIYLWLARIETGKHDIRTKHLGPLSRALGTTVKALTEGA